MVKVLFVCLGNICRSPTAEGVFRGLVEREGLSGQIEADSAGVGSWHIGSPPDRRAQAAALHRGIDLSGQRARQVKAEDFHRFDYVLAMDSDNHRDLTGLCPAGEKDRLHMFLKFAPNIGHTEVPDPYYDGENGFEIVLDMIEAASEGLLADIRDKHL
ncbi:MAG: low molecular weight phosphotyrosine protein phosphatase [Rhodospirillales bacterium]|nr:low molecular weight phosphotyrosine protein phosphatase [Alphaproteobacteria bacterium]MBL6948438.1 low molecular weight phosphotyrosine protein phosphatase [Rhodospirillales bacterium]